MPPQTGTALILLVGFVLPGFITVLIRERTIESATPTSDLNRLLRVAYYSVWSYIVLAAISLVAGWQLHDFKHFFESHQHNPALLAMVAAGAILIPPVLVALAGLIWHELGIGRWVVTKFRLNQHHQTPSAWDHFFDQRKAVFVKAGTKSGAVVAGYYGAESFAAYAKDGRDLYLEERWSLDDQGDFDRRLNGDAGLWLPAADVDYIEFYTPDNDGPQAEKRAQGRPQAAQDDRSAQTPEAD